MIDNLDFFNFQPTYKWIPGEHRIPGGIFPIPPLAADLVSRLPPPKCFDGPFVILDMLLRTIATNRFEPPEPPAPIQGMYTHILSSI